MTEQSINVRITHRHDAAEGIVCLELAALNGAALPRFEPGAHVDVHLGSGLVRQYSLCNDPGERHRYRLGILLESQGRGGSAEIHRDFVAGKTVRISPPRNRFRLVAEATHSVLLAGGIGVTPLLAMAFWLSGADQSFELHYLSRSRSRAAFLEEITASRFAERAHVYFDDGPESQRFDTAWHIPAPQAGMHLYVCGPKGFMDAMIGAARSKGWPEDRIHLEYFAIDVDKTGGAFTVEARRSGKMLIVQPSQTIAEALMAADIDVPLSCESGICGTCLTAVIEGIPDHRDSYLTSAERAENRQMTVCCSRSLGETLVLDI